VTEYKTRFANQYDPVRWLDLVMLNGWVRYDTNHPAPQVLRSADGWIHLRGLVRSGSTPRAFVLPYDFRPRLVTHLSTLSDNAGTRGVGMVVIDPSGTVDLYGSTSYFVLNGLLFDTRP
jgi:hypothetical protein